MSQKIFDFVTGIVNFIESLRLTTVLMMIINVLMGLIFGYVLFRYVLLRFGGL